ncbi:MAG: hypothetical protein U0359_35495 [Byssovorax sp.]
MTLFAVETRCECQARLSAVLDDKHQVIEGKARSGSDRETAPAHSINPRSDRFDLGWLCPFCGRNTLRTFDAGGLRAIST